MQDWNGNGRWPGGPKPSQEEWAQAWADRLERERLIRESANAPTQQPRKKPDDGPGFVYYARFEDGLVKIGHSANPVRRLKHIARHAEYAKHRKIVDAFCYACDDGPKGEIEAHKLNAKYRISKQVELFLLPPGLYEQRREELGGKPIEIVDGMAVA